VCQTKLAIRQFFYCDVKYLHLAFAYRIVSYRIVDQDERVTSGSYKLTRKRKLRSLITLLH